MAMVSNMTRLVALAGALFGALDYLTKPSHPDRLAESLRRYAVLAGRAHPPAA